MKGKMFKEPAVAFDNLQTAYDTIGELRKEVRALKTKQVN